MPLRLEWAVVEVEGAKRVDEVPAMELAVEGERAVSPWPCNEVEVEAAMVLAQT